jgi:hypothetical protein
MALEQLGQCPPVTSLEVVDQFAFRFLLHGLLMAISEPCADPIQLASVDGVT